MLIAVENTIQALQTVVENVPVGTNYALLQLMWVMLQERLLVSRGAILPALIAGGLSWQAARRSWAAMRYGVWESGELIEVWGAYVEREGKWQEREHAGYRGVAVDVTAFWRPRLKGWLGKHFHHLAGRALPAVSFFEDPLSSLYRPPPLLPCIKTAGRSNKYPWPPSIWSGLIVSSSLLTKVVNAGLNSL